MIKVLSVQSRLMKQREAAKTCGCRSFSFQDVAMEEKYVFATGGNSVGAAHGNLFNESHTAYLERRVQDVFASVGIQFEGRNHAVGSQSSAPEDPMCFEQIFGNDVDMFCWDYAITDNISYYMLLFSAYRAGVSSGKPAFLARQIFGSPREKRLDILQELEEMGLPTFYEDEDLWRAMKDAIPETQGLSGAEINAMPEYVRSFKCGGFLEKGDPTCGDEKFTKYICNERQRQTPWHPGFKDNGMTGTGEALFLSQALLDAAKDLAEDAEKDINKLLYKLIHTDDNLQHRFHEAPLPDLHKELLVPNANQLPPGFNASVFYKEKSLCHTARLPSQSRYLGYLTDSWKVGGPAPVGQETYDVGQPLSYAKLHPANGTMRLVQHDSHQQYRSREAACPVAGKQDYRDSFFTNHGDGWTRLTVPSESEKKAYAYSAMDLQGIVLLYPRLRERDFTLLDMGLDDFNAGRWQIRVNGINVTSLVEFGSSAYRYGNALAMKHGDDIHFPPNANGDYDIEIFALEPGSHVQVSSIVLY